MPIQFQCASCGHAIQLPDTAAGKQGKCPKCGAVLTVPAAGAAPLSAADEDFWSDLPDEKDKPAYPEEEAPKKAKKKTDAQVLRTYIKEEAVLQEEKSLKRTGLPWEDSEEGFFDRYWDTAIAIMNHTQDTWATMMLQGSFGKPTTFLLVGAVFGSFFLSFYYIVASIVLRYKQIQDLVAEGSGAPALLAQAFVIYLVALFFGSFFGSIIGIVVNVFLQAGLLQLLMAAFGIKTTNFETTYRVAAYSMGSIMVWMVIPAFGWILGFLIFPYSATMGLASAYNDSPQKAAGPAIVVSVLLVLPIFVLLGLTWYGLIDALLA